jgi:hypothetical protein
MNFIPAALVGIASPVDAVAGLRPQDVALGTDGHLRATVDLIEPRGHDYLLHLRLDFPGVDPVLAVVAGVPPPPVGAAVWLGVRPDRLHLFDGNDGTRIE